MSNRKPVDVQLEKVHKLVRDDILQEKDREQQDPKRILLTVTYNRFNRTYSSCLQTLERPSN